MFTSFVHWFFLYRCSKLLFTTIFHNSCSQLFFTTYVQIECKQPWFTTFVHNLKSNLLIKKFSSNKLGQRQSQTPFSSAFWVQKDFEPKNFGSKIFLTWPVWFNQSKLNLTCHKGLFIYYVILFWPLLDPPPLCHTAS